MHGVVTIKDGNEEVKDVPFVLLISFWRLPSSLPFCILSISVFCPVLVGFFQVSCVCLTLCQIFASLFEYLKLFLIVMANFLVLARNSSQSLCDEEEFLPTRGPMSFKSGMHGSRRELELTEFHRDGSNGGRDGEGFLSVNHRSFGCRPNWERFGSVHVDHETGGSGRGDVC